MKEALVSDPAGQRTTSRWQRIGLGIAGAGAILILLIIAAWVIMLWRMSDVPDDLDYGTTQFTDAGLYSVSYAAPEPQPPLNQLHTWTLHVETPDGVPVENATITVDGDMPQHGHGLPTQPLVTEYLGNGDYLVEGMKFQMGGWWVVEFFITDGENSDHVLFNLMLQR